MAVGDIWEVTASLNVRKGPSKSSTIVTTLPKGERITEISGSKDGWINTAQGYTSSEYLVQVTSLFGGNKVNTTSKDSSAVSASQTAKARQDAGADGGYNLTYISNLGSYSSSSFFNLDKIIGVFGLPYQFLPTADCRTDGGDPFNSYDGIGMEYADRIASKMPILFIAPGKPSFMSEFSNSEQSGILSQMISGATGGINDLLEDTGRYYTFEYDVPGYYSFVNPMCRIAAIYMDIGDIVLNGTQIRDINWRTYTSNHIEGIFSGGNEYLSIPFYLDSDPTVSENFSNSTTESSLASTVNGVSDLGRELKFLTGYSSRALDEDWFSQNADVASNIEAINQEIEGILGKGNFLTNLSKHLNTVASGGRLMFPEIWSESSMSRSYNVSIKLVSPDANKLSVYLNVLVPLFHLIGLVAPQSVPSNPNGYTNPFIVRAIFKSHFNVDMGIITDMSVTKGANCQWTVDGIPTSIEVSMSIKDLYDVMSITSAGDGLKFDTMSNTAQMDYIANLCGINMYKPEPERLLSMFMANLGNKPGDLVQDIWTGINQSITSGILGIFRGN